MSGYDDFKSKIGYGARSNLYELEFNCPSEVATAMGINTAKIVDDMKLLVSGLSVPAKTIGVITTPYQGEVVNLSGDPTFEAMTFTFINDMDYEARSILENWLALMVDPSSNARTNPSVYKQNIKLYHCSNEVDATTGRKLRKKGWILEGAFPTTVSAVDKKWDAVTTLETGTFSITYDKHKRLHVVTGNPIE